MFPDVKDKVYKSDMFIPILTGPAAYHYLIGTYITEHEGSIIMATHYLCYFKSNLLILQLSSM